MAPRHYQLINVHRDSASHELEPLHNEKALHATVNAAHWTSQWRPPVSLRNLIKFLIPSFLRSSQHEEKRANGSLAALDGLRGLACLCVLNQHYTQCYTDRLFKYGFLTAPTDVYVPQWPFVRIFWTGSAQVFTFFVLSGYVLSVKPLKQMRSQDQGILKTLNSSVFRRGMRLFLPSIAVLIIAAIVAQLGLYMASVEVWHRGLIATPENIVRPAASNWEMAKVLMRDIVGMTNFFNVGGYIPSLQEHLWTINVEFRSSMLLYLFQIGTARLRSWVRILLGIGSIVYLGSLGRSSNLLFFCGALLTEFDLIYQDYRSTLNGPRLNSRTSHHNDPETLNEDLSLRTYPPHWHRPNRRSLRSTLQYLTSPTAAPFRLFHFTCFLLALYLMCTPLVDAHAPGYANLTNYLLPFWYHAEYESHFLWTLGSMLLLSSASHSLDIRPLYTNAFAQYLGRVSYALYFIHGPVLHIAAYGMLPIWEELTAPLGGRETQIGFVAQWLLGAAVSWPIVVYLADLLWRALDVPSVRFARWCEDVLEDRRWKQGRR